MFYYASKIVWFFATPSNLLAALALAGLVLAPARTRIVQRTGRTLLAVSVIGLPLAGLSPLANWVILPLENRFPAYADGGGAVAGIVVLGGAVQAEESLARGMLALNEAGERMLALGALARRYPDAKLLFSGGAATLVGEEPAEAEAVQRFAADALGVPPERILLDYRSRTTHENAVLSRDLASPQPGERWLLVTSAWHMPRAVGCFRQAGFAVVPYPVDYRTRGPEDRWRWFRFLSEGLRRLDLAAKEWAGLVGYRAAGYTQALFPGP